ncbi:hypothetical protein [Candidatus Nitrotoga arctica]|uniref:Uncharacterized protein n=1 Tax=Candidatus Nitrotoga arctica TaxID=453162 RepID=A0ABN8AQL1_9PROT|nr:hypothetical protein [Candidatus Nitrotoga arctica]CAG9934094.1 conserved protein of unknown function [Candidatus Nitrotoga arctica]
MSTTKFHACNEIDCETLTSGVFCKAHTQPELSSETSAQTKADIRLQEIMAAEEKSRQWEIRADKFDTMRAELAELRGSPRSNDHEQPVFSKQYEENYHG